MVEINLVGSVEEMKEQIQEFVNSFKKETKTVMWFSRHDMSEEQMIDLKRIYGDVETIKVNGTIPNAFVLKELVDICDVVAIVAPINIQQQFLTIAGKEKDVIIAQSERVLIKNQDGEDKVQFVFTNWFKLEKIEVVMTKL